eukprot:Hpha_TRINITY_DN7477_c0_g1::TRINITY_DN7477_c0_g1_i1::g.95888::m.95888
MLHERGFAARFKEPFVFRGGGKFVIITLEQQAASVGADEEGEAGDPLGTFSTVWDGSLALAEVLSKGGSGIRIEGAQVVELGSGCGLGGLVAAACGARSVALTDLPEALPLLRRNLRANSFVLWGCNVSVKPYTWGSPDLPVDSVDLILAADLVYLSRPLLPPCTFLVYHLKLVNKEAMKRRQERAGYGYRTRIARSAFPRSGRACRRTLKPVRSSPSALRITPWHGPL